MLKKGRKKEPAFGNQYQQASDYLDRMSGHELFEVRIASVRFGVEKLVESVPQQLLGPGSEGPALLKCLADLVKLGCEVVEDDPMLEAHALSDIEAARPILAAGLYSSSHQLQAMAAKALYNYINDGDLYDAFPMYWQPFNRLMELLDSNSWEVVGWSSLAIATLCHAPFYCMGSTQIDHMEQFYKLGIVDEFIGLLNDPPANTSDSFYTQNHAQSEVAYALTTILRNRHLLDKLPEVPQKLSDAPGVIPRLVELGMCSERNGEVQRVALLNLIAAAELSPWTAQAVFHAGGKELAQKVIKRPFAGSANKLDQETKLQASELLRILKLVEPGGPAESGLGVQKPVQSQAPAPPAPQPTTPNTPSVEAVDQMSVKQLKALLREHGVGNQGCLEKADLQRKARVVL